MKNEIQSELIYGTTIDFGSRNYKFLTYFPRMAHPGEEVYPCKSAKSVRSAFLFKVFLNYTTFLIIFYRIVSIENWNQPN
jgi:hypothetical protein